MSSTKNDPKAAKFTTTDAGILALSWRGPTPRTAGSGVRLRLRLRLRPDAALVGRIFPS